MAAKSYVLGFARRPLTAYGADWQLGCLLCETLPSLENGGAVPRDDAGGQARHPRHLAAARGCPLGRRHAGLGRGPALRLGGRARRRDGIGPAEFYRSAYELIVEDARTVTLRFDKLTFELRLRRAISSRCPRISSARAGRRTRAPIATAPPTTPRRPIPASGPAPTASPPCSPAPASRWSATHAWSGPAPAFRRIQIRTVENTAAMEAQLLAGQIDMVAGELGLPVEQAAALERRTGGALPRRIQARAWSTSTSTCSTTTRRWRDRRVRQALLLAIDRAQIVARLFEGRQTVAHTARQPARPDARRRHAALAATIRPAPPPCWTRPAGAAAPTASAATPPARRLSFELMTTAGNRAREAVQQVLQGMWRAGRASRRASATSRRGCCSPRPCPAAASAAPRCSPGSAGRRTCRAPPCIPTRSRRAERNWSGQNYGGYRNAEMDALLEALPAGTGPREAPRAVVPPPGHLRRGPARAAAVVPRGRACLAALAGWRAADRAPQPDLALGGGMADAVIRPMTPPSPCDGLTGACRDCIKGSAYVVGRAHPRRGGRVAEGGGLLNRYTG